MSPKAWRRTKRFMTEATGMAVYATDDNPLILVRRFTWLPKAIILICRGQTFTRWNMHIQVLKAFICLTYKQLKDRLVLLYVLVQTPLLTTTGEERSTKTPKHQTKEITSETDYRTTDYLLQTYWQRLLE